MSPVGRTARGRRSGLLGTARVLALTFGGLTLAACATESSIVALPVPPVPSAPAPTTVLQAALQSEMDADVLAFYRAREFRSAWLDWRDVAAVRGVLGRADEQGLHARDYTLPVGGRPTPIQEAAR